MELTVKQVQQNLKASHDMLKSYADVKRNLSQFYVGDHAIYKGKSQENFLDIGKVFRIGT